MPHYYPIFVKLAGQRCVVVGGGQVALRKAAVLIQCGAKVSVISPRLCAGLSELASSHKINVLHRPYRKGDLNGAYIAIIASGNRAVNRDALVEAKANRTMVNVVDAPGLSDFIVPSVVRRGPLAIAISTSGKSPAFARSLRIKLEDYFGDEFGILTDIIENVRLELKKMRVKASPESWQAAIAPETMAKMVKDGRGDDVRALLLERLGTQQQL